MGFFALLLSELARERTTATSTSADCERVLLARCPGVDGSGAPVTPPWRARAPFARLRLTSRRRSIFSRSPRVFRAGAGAALGGFGAGLHLVAATVPCSRARTRRIVARSWDSRARVRARPRCGAARGAGLVFALVVLRVRMRGHLARSGCGSRARLRRECRGGPGADDARCRPSPARSHSRDIRIWLRRGSASLTLSAFPLEPRPIARANGYACSAFVLGSLLGMFPLTALGDRVGAFACSRDASFSGSMLALGLARATDFRLSSDCHLPPGRPSDQSMRSHTHCWRRSRAERSPVWGGCTNDIIRDRLRCRTRGDLTNLERFDKKRYCTNDPRVCHVDRPYLATIRDRLRWTFASL